MSGISSGIGLISGIDRQGLINQLIAIDARPMKLLEARVQTIGAQRAAFLELSARLLAVQNSILGFSRSSLFRKFGAVSSNTNIVSAAAGETATPGTHTFRVRSLATNHSVVSRGFGDADRTPIGAGTITIESGRARVNRSTELDTLLGFRGVRRGVITITDHSGTSADIDLTSAVTVDDVLDAINSARGIRVRATVTGLPSETAGGDRIVLEDLTGSETGSLVVADRAGGFTAADLGIAGRVTGNRLEGTDLVRLTPDTPLSFLNDGSGVGRASAGSGDDLLFQTSYGSFGVSLSDTLTPEMNLRVLNGGHGVRLGVIRVTDRSGQAAELDLSQAVTVQEVREAIEAADVAVSVAIVDSNLQIRDTSETPPATAQNLKIEDVSGFAAADLGIAADVASDTITGRDIYRVATVGDVLRAINLAPGNHSFVEASLSTDGKGITLTAVGFDNAVTVSAGEGSTAARDLGLLDAAFLSSQPFVSRRLVGGLNTVLLQSLRGGAGVHPGQIRFTDRASQSSVIDFAGAVTLQDVIDLINADPGLGLQASANPAGNGVILQDQSGGPGAIVVEDVAGSLAVELGIAVSVDAADSTKNEVNGGNLQLRYVSRATTLAELNALADFRGGEFRITDSAGQVFIVAIPSNVRTVGEAIDAINLRTPDTIEARINDNGDGIVLIDHANGTGTLTVQDQNGRTVAADLRLAGTARTGQNFIDGSLETRISLDAHNTLRELASNINAAGAGLVASVINDGRSVSPFALTITSETSGRRGQFVIDAQGPDLGFENLVRAQDAVVTVGSGAGAASKVVTNPTNTLDRLIEGVSFELLAPAVEDVTVTVAQDIDAVVEDLRAFVESFNEVQSAIDERTSFNQDTLERGSLLGDATVNLIRSRLHRLTLQPFGESDAAFARLASVGIRRASNNRLELNEERFREAYQDSPDQVERLFTDPVTGAGTVLKKALEDLTRDFDGVLARRDSTLADQQESLNDRIADLNRLLEAKRARLEAQFVGLETALANLQEQQQALATLTARQLGIRI